MTGKTVGCLRGKSSLDLLAELGWPHSGAQQNDNDRTLGWGLALRVCAGLPSLRGCQIELVLTSNLAVNSAFQYGAEPGFGDESLQNPEAATWEYT